MIPDTFDPFYLSITKFSLKSFFGNIAICGNTVVECSSNLGFRSWRDDVIQPL